MSNVAADVLPFCDHAIGLFLSPSQPKFPLPKPQRRRAQQLKMRPERWIRGLHEAFSQCIERWIHNEPLSELVPITCKVEGVR